MPLMEDCHALQPVGKTVALMTTCVHSMILAMAKAAVWVCPLFVIRHPAHNATSPSVPAIPSTVYVITIPQQGHVTTVICVPLMMNAAMGSVFQVIQKPVTIHRTYNATILWAPVMRPMETAVRSPNPGHVTMAIYARSTINAIMASAALDLKKSVTLLPVPNVTTPMAPATRPAIVITPQHPAPAMTTIHVPSTTNAAMVSALEPPWCVIIQETFAKAMLAPAKPVPASTPISTASAVMI